jgi:hypothetical protein
MSQYNVHMPSTGSPRTIKQYFSLLNVVFSFFLQIFRTVNYARCSVVYLSPQTLKIVFVVFLFVELLLPPPQKYFVTVTISTIQNRTTCVCSGVRKMPAFTKVCFLMPRRHNAILGTSKYTYIIGTRYLAGITYDFSLPLNLCAQFPL